MRAIVQIAVSGLLVQKGHTVVEASDGNGLLVLANATQPHRPAPQAGAGAQPPVQT